MTKPKKTKLPISQFDFFLPPKLISQQPTKPRDAARLLILDRKNNSLRHSYFFNLAQYLKAGDVLVLNNSRVIPARLIGHKNTGGKIEIFLLNKTGDYWHCLIGGAARIGEKIQLTKNIFGKLIKKSAAENLVKFNCSDKKLFLLGQTPTPPYIKTKTKRRDYQTVYAQTPGSVAAPTAGLHFTKRLLNQLKNNGVQIEYLTLHVGLGTFQPIKTNDILKHQIHSEWAELDAATAKRLNQAKRSGQRIIAVGTTTVRTLEALSNSRGIIKPQNRWIDIFIYPGYKFKFVDAIITNFHLPKSTLIVLVCAFADQDKIFKAYRQAIKKKYRFYSFGDAMLIK
jgi:S-adenosylmethionine:tRNA ribosyltransferase-isomerase